MYTILEGVRDLSEREGRHMVVWATPSHRIAFLSGPGQNYMAQAQRHTEEWAILSLPRSFGETRCSFGARVGAAGTDAACSRIACSEGLLRYSLLPNCCLKEGVYNCRHVWVSIGWRPWGRSVAWPSGARHGPESVMMENQAQCVASLSALALSGCVAGSACTALHIPIFDHRAHTCNIWAQNARQH